MSDEVRQTVRCGGCGMELDWSAGVAGRVGVCSCLQEVVLPGEPGGVAARVENVGGDAGGAGGTGGDAGVAGSGVLRGCPRCLAWMEPEARVCVRCGYDQGTGELAGPVGGGGGAGIAGERVKPMERFARSWRGRVLWATYWVLPWVLAVGCFLGSVLQAWVEASAGAFGQRVSLLVARWVVGYGLLVGATALISAFVRVNFDTWPQRLLRVAAMVSTALLLQGLAVAWFGDVGLVAAYLGRVPIYYVLLAVLFPMESDERLLTTIGLFFAEACLVIGSIAA